jgi:hypothetical protein
MTYKNENSGSFTNAELMKNKDTIYISVFDNLGSYQNRKDNPQLFTLQVEKRYLGGIKIPLARSFHQRQDFLDL